MLCMIYTYTYMHTMLASSVGRRRSRTSLSIGAGERSPTGALGQPASRRQCNLLQVLYTTTTTTTTYYYVLLLHTYIILPLLHTATTTTAATTTTTPTTTSIMYDILSLCITHVYYDYQYYYHVYVYMMLLYILAGALRGRGAAAGPAPEAISWATTPPRGAYIMIHTYIHIYIQIMMNTVIMHA